MLLGSQQIQSHSTKKKVHQHLKIVKLAMLLKFWGIFLGFTLSSNRIIFFNSSDTVSALQTG